MFSGTCPDLRSSALRSLSARELWSRFERRIFLGGIDCGRTAASPNGRRRPTSVGSKRSSLTATAAASRRRAALEKVGNGGDKLRRSKWLRQHDAVGNTLGGPVCGVRPAHVNYWKFRIDFSGELGDFPAFHSASQIDVGRKRAVFAPVSP